MAEDRELAFAAASWAGIDWSIAQQETLARYGDWLTTEAIDSGGIGPAEGERIWRRHLADSLLFAGCWDGSDPPNDLGDVGAGVGLPGIPLAIAWPDTAVTLIDRAGRRTELARRAVRVVGIENVTVATADVHRWRVPFDFVTFRGSLAPGAALQVGRRICRAGGTVAVGVTHGERDTAPLPARSDGVEIVRVPTAVLDSPVRLLKMKVDDA